MMSCGSIFTIGSISPYIASYFYVSTTQTQLLLPSAILLCSLVTPFGGQLTGRIPSHWQIALSGAISITCMLLASFVPRTFFLGFAMLFVFGMAVCNGLGYIVPIRLGWKVFPERPGLVSGIIIGGFSFGALIFTYASTLLVNPDNLNLEINENGKMVFPETVALMVPVLMRWLALGCSIFLIASLLLITEPTSLKITEYPCD